MEELIFGSEEFDQAVFAAFDRAIAETLAAGVPAFYVDRDDLNIMEMPDGRRFEVRFISGAPSGENYEIMRELVRAAA